MGPREKLYFRISILGAGLTLLGLLLGGAWAAASWVSGLGIGLVLAGWYGVWSVRSSKPVSQGATVAVMALCLLGSVAVGVVRGDDTADEAAAVREATTTTTLPEGVDPPGLVNGLNEEKAPSSWAERYGDENGITEGGSQGWGSFQPGAMRQIHLGTSDEPMTPARRKVLADMLVRARDAALEVGTLGNAKKMGYQQVSATPSDGRIEYVNFAYQDEFDVDHPSMVVFADDSTDDAPVISIAYGVKGSYKDGPPEDFPLEAIPWHYHGPLCFDKEGHIIADMHTFKVDKSTYINGKPASCEAHGGVLHTEFSSWMVDLWVVPGWENPWGLVSSKHPDLYPKPWYDPKGATVPGVTHH